MAEKEENFIPLGETPCGKLSNVVNRSRRDLSSVKIRELLKDFRKCILENGVGDGAVINPRLGVGNHNGDDDHRNDNDLGKDEHSIAGSDDMRDNHRGPIVVDIQAFIAATTRAVIEAMRIADRIPNDNRENRENVNAPIPTTNNTARPSEIGELIPIYGEDDDDDIGNYRNLLDLLHGRRVPRILSS